MPDKSDLTCFVIMGYGPKKDHNTGRFLDLDKTFENLIKPVFDKLKITCFRAKDIRHTGVIDVPMYEWIYKSDIVVADLSTLNSNALYELGVRHALKPYTTIVISENQCEYPFDVNHTVVEPYEHLGKDIGVSESKRFKKELTKKVKAVLKEKVKDSPVYTFLPNLTPPNMSNIGAMVLRERSSTEPTLSVLIEDAENAKNNKEFKIAAELYKVCLKFEPNNVFLKQRLVLATYKSEKPNKKQALLDAWKLLLELEPDSTIDIETLGIAGAIHKRLFELTDDLGHLKKSINYYERGFYISADYYNGINLAYLFNVYSSKLNDSDLSKSYKTQAEIIRHRVVEICQGIITARGFDSRNDRHWVYQSLAQAHLGLGQSNQLPELIDKINEYSEGPFDLETFYKQNERLTVLIKE